MYLHIGKDFVVKKKDIIGIFNIEYIKNTREYKSMYSNLEENKNLINIKKDRFQTGVSVIPDFSKDNNDRNRTSPFAFTGNKFEFRGVGSSQSIAIVNTILNGILAYEMQIMADEIDKGNKPIEVIRKFLNEHKRIIFNGNRYTDEWLDEAKARGLLNLPTTPDALPHFIKEKNVELFAKHHIFTKAELHSRYEILLENYRKIMIFYMKRILIKNYQLHL